MLDRTTVTAWLDAYVQAWKTYDPRAIGDLFAEEAVYSYTPYSEPIHGQEAIVAAWLRDQDTPGAYDAHYEPISIEGNLAVANGRSRYTEEDGATPRTEFDNIFVLRFDDDGRCIDYREWYVTTPMPIGTGFSGNVCGNPLRWRLTALPEPFNQQCTDLIAR